MLSIGPASEQICANNSSTVWITSATNDPDRALQNRHGSRRVTTPARLDLISPFIKQSAARTPDVPTSMLNDRSVQSVGSSL